MTVESTRSLDPGESGTTIAVVPSLWRLVAQHGSAIAPFQEHGSSTPFYCVHSISGGVGSFERLSNLLGSEQRFYGIQVTKNRLNTQFAASIETMARHYVEALVAFQPQGPIALGGWSAGAVVALEMAQQLQELGRDVPLLVALDGAPCNTGAGLNRWHPLYNWKLFCNLPRWIRNQLVLRPSTSALAAGVVGKIRFRLNASSTIRTEQTLDGDAVKALLHTAGLPTSQSAFIRAFYHAMLVYKPKPCDCSVIVYDAKVQPLDHLRQVGAVWKKLAKRVEIISLDGSHESILDEPAINVLADHLRERLAEIHRPS